MTTRKLKFGGAAKAPWHGDLVEADDQWLVVYYAAPAHQLRQSGEPVAHALRYFGLDCPLSVLVCFDGLGRVMEYQCDAGLPSKLVGRTIEFVDLDLDLIVAADLTGRERDGEAFANNRARLAYPAEVVSAAYEGVETAWVLLKARARPFDGSAEALLGRVLAAQGPL